MMSEYPAMAVTFAVAAALAFLLGGFVTFLRRADSTGVDPNLPVPPRFGLMTPGLAGIFPASSKGREEVRQTLIRAGYFEPVALNNFLATRTVLLFVPLLFGLFGGILVEGPLGVVILGTGFVCAILGYAVPRLILNFQADARTDQIRRGLPTLMDTLGLTLSTGASLPGAMLSASQSVRRGYPDLSQEVRLVVTQAPLHSMTYALEQFRSRQPVPELGSLVFLLSQGDRLGTDITRGLWELSSSLQVTARQRAESAANRSNFYMLFPTVLCLMLAAGLALAGPGIVQLIQSNRDVDRILEDAQQQEKKLREDTEKRARELSQPKGQQQRPEL